MGHSIRTETGKIHETIGYMSQRFGLYPDLSVMENIDFYADLSGGMKQKLGLACALIHTPKVLFLDEPTNGVAPVSRRDFWRILYRLLREKVTIFVSTAYLDEAERFQRLALMHQGKLLALGTPVEVKTLYPGVILEVRCGDPRRASAVLREELPRAIVGIFGDRVHVGSRDSELARQGIEKALRNAGIPVSQVRPVEPLLEDVFVAVLSSGGEAQA